MTEKRFSIKAGSIIGLSSIYTDNGKVMTQLEVLDVLIKQHETIQILTKENEQLKIDLGIGEDNHKLDKEIIDDIHNEFQRVKKENEQLKQQLFETSKELLWATSDEVDRALHYEDEVEELRKEIFE